MYQIVSASDTKPPTCFNYIHIFYPYVIFSKSLQLQYLLLLIQIPIAMPKNSHLQHSVVGPALFTPWQPGLPQLIPGEPAVEAPVASVGWLYVVSTST